LRKAFTILELLIVCCILALLAAILWPVYAKAREPAKRTACTQEMRQAGIALDMYYQDSEAYPVPGTEAAWTLMDPYRCKWGYDLPFSYTQNSGNGETGTDIHNFGIWDMYHKGWILNLDLEREVWTWRSHPTG
jgi:Tfp pilus assembly protein PilE